MPVQENPVFLPDDQLVSATGSPDILAKLPPLFFRLLADKPLDQLANGRFVAMTMLATYCAFAIAFAFGAWRTRGDPPEGIMYGVAGSYAKVG